VIPTDPVQPNSDRRALRRHLRAGGSAHRDHAASRIAASFAVVLLAAAAMTVAAWQGGARRVAQSIEAASVEATAHDHFGAGHETNDGLPLAASTDESVTPGSACAGSAPVRAFDVVAINVDITLNRYLDHDPQGRMYVLESELPRVRDEEARNNAARAFGSEPGVSIGLQGDAIQPLTLRVNQGDCLRITLRNVLDGEPASLHIHGSSLRVAGTSEPAIATNPHALAAPGATVQYEWAIPAAEPEGTHYFHSHGDTRAQTSHGLFGAVIVERAGSHYRDPSSGEELRSGWSAIVEPPSGPAFREFALYYHEIGDENYQPRDGKDGLVPQVDPLTTAYRPDGRALNYRSEPFMNRLTLQQATTGTWDESAAYSSYEFGDPATPMMRAYIGDPVKQRIIHGGSEVFHVHHVHGGAIRWRRQPGAEDGRIASGLEKHPPLIPSATERTDSQSIGPSETFDIEDECGAGGCQQSVGDFLVHCHVAHHYFAGMWTIWRVYNTRQAGAASTDALPALRELPDRIGKTLLAVTSDKLADTTVDWSGKRFDIPSDGVASWVERELPPRGLPRGYDASVMDWERRGDLYLNEPSDTRRWPGYASSAPDARPPLLFDPTTGKLAYPFLQPHLGKRPPFAPNHGPAPYLDPASDSGVDPPAPGANGPASLCPEGTRPATYAINAITLPIAINERANILDPAGELFVLREQEDAVRADNKLRVPLAIRANAGEDCIDVLLRSELKDTPENHNFAKVNLHIHFAQFDVQASDGVVAGFNFEQSVRPYEIEGERVVNAVAAGASNLRTGSTQRFQTGVIVGVGMDRDATFESQRVIAVEGDKLEFAAPLRFAHDAGEIVSTEFVRYRWYPDVQFGTAYFHDHVNALSSWKHGLFGALVTEPPGSSYHDPDTGAELRSGPIADVHTSKPVSVDVHGPFRELVLFVQDDNPLTHLGRSTGSTFNLRAEPLATRGDDPARVFSSATTGDPETPIVRAYLGDPVVFRTLTGGTNDVHTVHIDGHWFRSEPYSGTSPPIDTINVGISERKDLVIPRAGGPQQMAGDYLYYNGRSFKLREGSWGLLRVLPPDTPAGPRVLPGVEPRQSAEHVCPSSAPERKYDVAAVAVPLPVLDQANGLIYVLKSQKRGVLSGSAAPQPLVLRANVGDCIRVSLTNETTASAVTFHTDLLAADPAQSGGVEAGRNGPQAVEPSATRTYEFYASPEAGETTALVRDWGDVTQHPGMGLYGAIVVGPGGATYRDPTTGGDGAREPSWQTIVTAPGRAPYRDFTLFMQDEDEAIGNHRMPYTIHVGGTTGINYQSAPLADRAAAPGTTVYAPTSGGMPATPLLEAYAGDTIRLHVLSPWSEQSQVFSVENHEWAIQPLLPGTNVVSSQQIGGLESLTMTFVAGGDEQLPGDYLYGDHREPYREAGLWGILRVHPRGGSSAAVRPLSPSGHSRRAQWSVLVILAAAGFLSAGTLAVWRCRPSGSGRDRVATELPPTSATR